MTGGTSCNCTLFVKPDLRLFDVKCDDRAVENNVYDGGDTNVDDCVYEGV